MDTVFLAKKRRLLSIKLSITGLLKIDMFENGDFFQYLWLQIQKRIKFFYSNLKTDNDFIIQKMADAL